MIGFVICLPLVINIDREKDGQLTKPIIIVKIIVLINNKVHSYCTAQNFGRFRIARKLVEKILAADHANDSSVFEITRTYNIWQINFGELYILYVAAIYN